MTDPDYQLLACVSAAHDELLTVSREQDHLVIRIGVDALRVALTTADTWPTSGDGRVAQILNQDLFLEQFAGELLREDEQGATPLHRAFDEAAEYLNENGCEYIEELPEDEDE